MTETQEPQQPISQRIGVFLPALLICVLLTTAVLRLDFESGSPMKYVLPFLPFIFTFTYWLPKKFSYYFMAIGAVAPCMLFLGIYNTGAFVIIIAAYASVFQVFKTTRIRIVVSLLMTALLAFLRIGFLQLPVIPLAAPVAGSMIMFRFTLMLYEHHYTKTESTWWQKFSYLMIPPALAFPLFPILDYKSFLNNHRPQDPIVIRIGITRIAAGLVFMMIYRICYLYFIPGYVEVIGPLTAFVYVIGNYLYVLNVIGILWMSVGYLGLLGFDLPQVFNYIFLIDSFRDIWKRINTYWRDFVVKVVYYPLYFKLRKKTKHVVLITALITLTVSAVLHGWQWFWLQGTIELHSPGILFWSILGLVISINLSLQKSDVPNQEVATRKSIFMRSLRITGMILFMSLMWSLWNSSTLGEWLNLLHYFSGGYIMAWIIIGACILVTVFFVWLLLQVPDKPAGSHFLNRPYNQFLLVIIGILFVLPTISYVRENIPGKTGDFICMISQARMNFAEESAATENYYNRMLASDGIGSKPWEMHTPGGEAKSGLDQACIRRNDILVRELIPNKVTVLDGWSISTNSFGMRDKEYSLRKPPGVYRIAILGASYEMGSGVPQDSVFEALLENILADTFGVNKIEVLNFSVGGYHLPQQVWIAQNKIPPFEPDLILCFVHPADATRNSNYLASLVKNGTNLVYPELYAIKKQAGAEQFMDEKVLVNRFYPFSHQIAEWSINTIRETAYDIKAAFGVVYIPSLGVNTDAEYYRELYHSQTPDNLKVSTLFFDHADLFLGNENRYQLAKDPTHPNSEAHSLIAQTLAEDLVPVIRNHQQKNP